MRNAYCNWENTQNSLVFNKTVVGKEGIEETIFFLMTIEFFLMLS